jgi:hypothetical protein
LVGLNPSLLLSAIGVAARQIQKRVICITARTSPV